MTDWTPLIVAMLAFCAMGGIAFVAGQYYVRSVQINRRLSATQSNAFVDTVSTITVPLPASLPGTSTRSASESTKQPAENFV